MSIFKTAAVALTLMAVGPAIAGEAAKQATLYKTPQCGCCEITPSICARTALT
jgi:hypothetical protein